MALTRTGRARCRPDRLGPVPGAMMAEIEHRNRRLKVDLAKPIDLSLPCTRVKAKRGLW